MNRVLIDPLTVPADRLATARDIAYTPSLSATVIDGEDGLPVLFSLNADSRAFQSGKAANAVLDRLVSVLDEAADFSALPVKSFPLDEAADFSAPPPGMLDRTIEITDFTQEAAKRFVQEITALDNADQTTPILIVVRSYGGDIDALVPMLDTARIVRAPVWTMVQGYAMSCGAVMAACAAEPGRRLMMPLARFMVHELSSFTCGWNHMADMESNVKECKRVNDMLFEQLGQRTNITVDEWRTRLRNADGDRELYFRADEALAVGLVDKIVDKETWSAIVAPAGGEITLEHDVPEVEYEH